MDNLETPINSNQADPRYNPNNLLDFVIKKLNRKNDAALARTLGITPLVLSKIRHEKFSISATILIAMHEETGMRVRELRQLMGDCCQQHRETAKHVVKP
jgi:lipid II:glycine glycyltransferase (peptidoglycan interpeptide bridge formation enzyme)